MWVPMWVSKYCVQQEWYNDTDYMKDEMTVSKVVRNLKGDKVLPSV